LKNAVDKKVGEKTKVIEKFNKQINKDIAALLTEVADIKEEASVSCVRFIIYNINVGKVFYNVQIELNTSSHFLGIHQYMNISVQVTTNM
jgi:23S rRNA C2498 (ribose-2'-O)-methylase RlmM